MNITERMPDLVALVQKAAALRREVEAAHAGKADYEIRDLLRAKPEFLQVHEGIEGTLRGDSQFLEREGSLELHGVWLRFNADLTGHWLAIRAMSVSAEQACSDLGRFLDLKEFPYTVRIAVSGVFVEKDVQFGQGLWLRANRFDHLPKALHPREFLTR